VVDFHFSGLNYGYYYLFYLKPILFPPVEIFPSTHRALPIFSRIQASIILRNPNCVAIQKTIPVFHAHCDVKMNTIKKKKRQPLPPNRNVL
jgi:hypothetical protein